ANFGQSSGIPSFAPLSASTSATQAFLPPSSGTASTGGGGSSMVPASTGGGGGSLGTGTGGGGGGGVATNTAQPNAQLQFALLSRRDPPWAPVTIFALG